MSNDTNRSELSFSKSQNIKANETEPEIANFNPKLIENSTDNEQIKTSEVLTEAESTGSSDRSIVTALNPKIVSSRITKERGW